MWSSTERRRQIVSALGVLAAVGVRAGPARAEPAAIARALLSPTSAAPQQLAPGQALDLTLLSATGLTPPPGLQEARAHRGLHVALCSQGASAGAAARLCTPLRIDDVRPLGAHSLAYRVRTRVERWLSEGTYDVYARYPGGEAHIPGGVRIGKGEGERVHVGPRGLGRLPEGAQISPLPAAEGGFAPGFVLLGVGSQVLAAPGGAPLELQVDVGAAETMRRVRVKVQGAPAGAAVFVRSAIGDSARGSDVTLPAGVLGELPIEVLAVAPDGRVGFARAAAHVRPQLAFGCALAAGRPVGGGSGPALSLLVLAVSATLGRRARTRLSSARPNFGWPTRE